jgi:two-component system, LytTR family, response regulator
MTTIIIDDEKPSRDLIKHFLKNYPAITIIAECDNGLTAVNSINTLIPDLIFLDIQMPDLNGFEVLNWLDAPQKPIIIFVTAYDNYALQAFNAHAIDYLLKPFSEERFSQAVNKAMHYFKNKDNYATISASFIPLKDTYNALKTVHNKTPNYVHQLIIKDKKRLLIIKTAAILFINAADDFLELHTEDGKKYLYDERLSKLEQQLDPSVFVRIHRSHIVNKTFVIELRPHFNGEYFIILKNNTTLKLSRSYKDNLERLIKYT